MPILGIVASSNYQVLPIQFLIGGSNALFYSSTDGLSWSAIKNNMIDFNSASDNDIANLYNVNGYIIASGSNFTSFSTDGVTWTRFQGGIQPEIVDIVYAENQYVAVNGVGPAISTDLVQWTHQNNGLSTEYANTFISYGNDRFVVANSSGARIASSTDGITWTERVATTTDLVIYDLIFANGLHVAVGDNSVSPAINRGLIRTSTNGTTWTTRTPSTGTTDSRVIYQVAWNGTYFLAATQTIGFQYSTNGTSWSTGTLPGTAATCEIVGASSDGTSFLKRASSSTYYTSTDGITWTSRTNALIGTTSYPITYFDNKWYLAENNATNALVTSTDLITWTGVANGEIRRPTSSLQDIIKVSDTYTIVGGGAILYSSTDLLTFTRRTPSTEMQNKTITTITYGNSTYLIGGTGGIINTSTDGITWTNRTLGVTSNVLDSVYGESLFVVGGASGMIRTSTNGVTWTSRTSGFGTSAVNGLAYESSLTNKFVAVGAGGTITSSTNGTTWTTRTSNVTTDLEAVTFANSTYVAVGVGITTSTDGTTWTSRTVPGTGFGEFETVRYNTTHGFIAIGEFTYSTNNNRGGYLTSTDAVTWTSRTSTTFGRFGDIFASFSV